MAINDDEINARLDDLGEERSAAELRSWVEEFAADNKRLNQEIQRLKKELRSGSRGGALCWGCEKLRRWLAATISGVAVCLFLGSWHSGGAALDIINDVSADDAYLDLKVTLGLAGVGSLPYLFCICRWQWLLYKNGERGILMACAQAFDSFKEGLGR
jgi:hypothetical protein